MKNRRISNHTIRPVAANSITTGANPRALSVQVFEDRLTVWIDSEDGPVKQNTRIEMYMDGQVLENDGSWLRSYIGTAQHHGVACHVYQCVPV